MGAKWETDQIPDQTGRTGLVTGASSGLGLVVARELARAGMEVTLACRDTGKGQAVAESITSVVPTARLSVEELDLANITSVRRFADRFSAARDRLDLLVNNAGVMAPPRRVTADGFELQFGTNHLGHFALTGLLCDLLESADKARVVSVSSTLHKVGRIDFEDLQGERRYRRVRAYAQSKLANLLFAFELERRLRARGSTTFSLAAHPGFAATSLQTAVTPRLVRPVMAMGNRLAAQSADMGALPLLYAGTVPGLAGGVFIGPDGRGEKRGYPTVVMPSRAAQDEETARRLWEVSEELTGVQYRRFATA
jgi:NAD(P)-dependent dehydrogenase (short-subunit alcohol dehydrogenase family)